MDSFCYWDSLLFANYVVSIHRDALRSVELSYFLIQNKCRLCSQVPIHVSDCNWKLEVLEFV